MYYAVFIRVKIAIIKGKKKNFNITGDYKPLNDNAYVWYKEVKLARVLLLVHLHSQHTQHLT